MSAIQSQAPTNTYGTTEFGVPEMSAILEQDEFTNGTISAEERDDWIKEFVDEFKQEREDILIDRFWETFSERMDEMRGWNKQDEEEEEEEAEKAAGRQMKYMIMKPKTWWEREKLR